MNLYEQLAAFLADALHIDSTVSEESVTFWPDDHCVAWVGNFLIHKYKKTVVVDVEISLQEFGKVITCQDIPTKRQFIEGLRTEFKFGTLRIVYENDLIHVYLLRSFELSWQPVEGGEIPTGISAQLLLEFENLCCEAEDLLIAFWLLHTDQLATTAAIELRAAVPLGEA